MQPEVGNGKAVDVPPQAQPEMTPVKTSQAMIAFERRGQTSAFETNGC
ncbi:hypothetical protein AB0F42_33295 [Streptomyces buecherae]